MYEIVSSYKSRITIQCPTYSKTPRIRISVDQFNRFFELEGIKLNYFKPFRNGQYMYIRIKREFELSGLRIRGILLYFNNMGHLWSACMINF